MQAAIGSRGADLRAIQAVAYGSAVNEFEIDEFEIDEMAVNETNVHRLQRRLSWVTRNYPRHSTGTLGRLGRRRGLLQPLLELLEGVDERIKDARHLRS